MRSLILRKYFNRLGFESYCLCICLGTYCVGPIAETDMLLCLVAAKHKETKQFFTMYNTLEDTKVYLEKEVSN